MSAPDFTLSVEGASSLQRVVSGTELEPRSCSERAPVRSGVGGASVLDACCGTRMFWFNQSDERAVYVDRREGTRIIDVGTPGTIGRTPKTVAPDMLADFRCLPFADESFWHVVFDPPHFHKGAGATGRIAFDFGLLDATWRDDLRAGFAECFRVLKPFGTLVFKWCEAEIPLREVLALTSERPLYGHRSGKKAQTHWIAFLKGGGGAEQAGDAAATKQSGDCSANEKLTD